MGKRTELGIRSATEFVNFTTISLSLVHIRQHNKLESSQRVFFHTFDEKYIPLNPLADVREKLPFPSSTPPFELLYKQESAQKRRSAVL